MTKSKIKILFLAANPLETPRLRLDRQLRVIDEKLRLGELRDKFDLRQYWAVRVSDLQGYLLRHQPDIVHFTGHGSQSSGIILEDDREKSHSVSIRALSTLFSLLKDNIRCVVLNGSYTERQAKAIAEHIECVIGMSDAIGDLAAITFAAGFYQALGFGRDVKSAFKLGCVQIDLENLNEQDTPKLFARRCDPKNIVLTLDNSQEMSVKPRHMPFLAPPRPTYELVGRDDLLQGLKQQLFSDENLALCALYGLPGMGKTALALNLAHELDIRTHFKDGVLWTGLGHDPDILALLGNWALALGFTLEDIAKQRTISERQARLSTAIGQRRMLLVIDDAWQPEAALAFKIGGPNCAYLLTTRQPGIALDFAGERITPVTELSLADGLTLLEQLAPKAVTAEREEARELVEAVGSLPLALILMGRYLQKATHFGQPRRLRRALTQLHDTEERLLLEQAQEQSQYYPALPSDAPLSLLAMIAMSDDALHASIRRDFYALSLFPPKPNTFSEEAAIEVLSKPVDTLDALIDYGLLESVGIGRYTLHQAIADYAKLNHADDAADKRMVTFFVNFASVYGTDYERLEPEINNLLVALDVASTQSMLAALVQGANALFHFLEIRGLYAQAETHLNHAEQAARALEDATALVTTLLNLGTIEERQGNYSKAKTYYKEGLVLARERQISEKISALLQGLGQVAYHRGLYDLAETYWQEGLTLARRLRQRERISLLLQSLGGVRYYRGLYDEAEAYYQEGLALAQMLHNHDRIMSLLINLGTVAYNRGAYGRSEAYYQQGVALARTLGHRARISVPLANLGHMAGNRGAYDEAEAYLQEGLALAREIGTRFQITLLLVNLSAVATKRGTYEQAEVNLQQALTLARTLEHRWLTSYAFTEWGKLYRKQQRWDLATTAFDEALQIAQEMGSKQFAAIALYGLAQVAFAQGNVTEARRLGKESLAIFEATDYGRRAEVKEWLAGLPAKK